jgi:hypothetical protein
MRAWLSAETDWALALPGLLVIEHPSSVAGAAAVDRSHLPVIRLMWMFALSLWGQRVEKELRRYSRRGLVLVWGESAALAPGPRVMAGPAWFFL